MTPRPLHRFIQHIYQTVGAPWSEDQFDRQLLQCYLSQRDEGAFARIVERHGSLVLGVCRRLAIDGHDADDVFQATFLVLVRKASSLKRQGTLAGWLYTVAYRLALRVKTEEARRREQQRRAREVLPMNDLDAPWSELRPLLDAELNQLPEKFRTPMVLCYLQGLSNEEAAQQLGCPVGTIKSRLAHARELLRTRLVRRGVVLSSATVLTALSTEARAAVSEHLLRTTVEAVRQFAVGAAPGTLSAGAQHLAQGALHAMLMTRLKIACVLILSLGMVGLGTVFLARAQQPAPAEDLADDGLPAQGKHVNNDVKRAEEVVPRRLLAISVNNYYYAAPLAYGVAPHDFHTLVSRLSKGLHIEPRQVGELSDSAPGARARPPLKGAIERSVADFLSSSRAQDHVAMLFTGHAAEVDGAAFLVPLEGDPTKAETLIPLTWLYDRLEKCPAHDKVLILDVCRHDPRNGSWLPEPMERMSKVLDDALREPPAGVRVWASCRLGQSSFEAEGSLFQRVLSESFDLEAASGVPLELPLPQTPLPVKALTLFVNRRTQELVSTTCHRSQIPRLAGAAGEDTVDDDIGRTMPPPVRVEWDDNRVADPASAKDVESLIEGLTDLVPLPDGARPLRAEVLPPCSRARLKLYPKAAEQTPFRAVVQEVEAALREPERFEVRWLAGGQLDSAPILAQNTQKTLAVTRLELEEILDKLSAEQGRRQETNRRWQIRNDFVAARVRLRLVHNTNYSVALSNVRKDPLPPLNPRLYTGWRLTPCDAFLPLVGAEARTMRQRLREARDLLKRIAADHPDTPFALLATRAAAVRPALEWTPGQ